MNFKRLPIVILTALMLCGLQVSAISLEITDIVSDTVGTTAVIPGSGDASNTDTWSIGQVGAFEINNGDYYLQINATNPTGGLSAGTDSLMVTRTVNSQGLTDDGTLTIYVRENSSRWSLDINFSLFTDIGLLNAASVTDFTLTSLDIDFSQIYSTDDSDFDSFTTYPALDSSPTNINVLPDTNPNVPTGYTGFTSSGNSTFSDPENAVTSIGDGSTFDITLSHDSVALFMFEFRDPPTVVPEPGTIFMAAGFFALFALVPLMRNRRRG